jgi:segregation and condensation protein A
LVRQLQEYRRYKEVAQQLRRWNAEGRRAFGRLAPSPLPVPRPAELENATLEALTAALQHRLEELSLRERGVPLPVSPRVTLAEKARRIHSLLQDREEVPLAILLSDATSCEEVVVTVWAVLEMFKRHWITFEQEDLFGPITVRRRSDTALDWDQRGEWWTELEELD